MESPPPIRHPPEIATSGRPWVAVVDDDDSIRMSLVRLLRGCGIEARHFASAEELLGRADGPAPACVVCDVQLGPGLNGYELKERLDAEDPVVPVILMTGETDLPVRMCQDAVASCLRKPFDPAELLARVRPLLDAQDDAHGDAQGDALHVPLGGTP